MSASLTTISRELSPLQARLKLIFLSRPFSFYVEYPIEKIISFIPGVVLSMILSETLIILPSLYATLLLLVISSSVIAKILAESLLKPKQGLVFDILNTELPIITTSDYLASYFCHLHSLLMAKFDITLYLTRFFRYWIIGKKLIPVPVNILSPKQNQFSREYWSGCPPPTR